MEGVVKDMENIKLAWLAGILDGEGNIGLYECGSVNKRNHGRLFMHHQYNVRITNMNTLLIQEVASIYSNILHRPIRIGEDIRKDRDYVVYYVNISKQQEVITLLTLLEPYLTSKKSQASVILQLLRTRTKGKKYSRMELEVIDILKRAKKENCTSVCGGNAEPSRELSNSSQACVETSQAAFHLDMD